MSDALWQLMSTSGISLCDMLIFLPSRRAVRTVEKMIASRCGGTAILPTLVALGEGVDDIESQTDAPDVISDTERVVVLSKLLSADGNIGNLSTALSVAHDLVRMQDYLENEGIDIADVDWNALVDERYASHFQSKAQILNILSTFMSSYAAGRITQTASRNRDIRAWINKLNDYKLVVVCGSTASVPATSDLMASIANLSHGRIILSGHISGRVSDFQLETNPYNSEYKFLTRIGVLPSEIIPIDVGPSVMDFMNHAFGNDCTYGCADCDLSNCNLIVAPREATEASIVAEIAARSVAENKSVLIITPDAAGNQRISSALAARNLTADFSGGTSGASSLAGRAILNLLDDWLETASDNFDKIYTACNFNLFDTVAQIVDMYMPTFAPQFTASDYTSLWVAIHDVSDALQVADIKLDLSDARAFISDALSGISIRGTMTSDARIVVLGTIESRMQTADVVILSGLNEGMFPARGYENAWLPCSTAMQIGLPSPDRKVSLQALDFMNLSCGSCVYWVRSSASGGVQSTESRFLSRVIARGGKFNTRTDILDDVLSCDIVAYNPLDYSAPTPPADWSDVFVTELEHLIHNPYSFYVKHILKLRVLDDYWAMPDTRAFGNLVHDVIEHASDLRPDVLVAQMDSRALDILGRGNIVFHFWHKRFIEIAPVISRELSDGAHAYSEISGGVKIAGRNVRARADRIWDGGVMDFKTGSAPTRSQLIQGNMPQLPLEAFMLSSGGFPIRTSAVSKNPIMKFLQLKNGDVRVIEYDAATTGEMMRAAVDKVTELFNMYSAGTAPYEYHETNDNKYKQYDDFARIHD